MRKKLNACVNVVKKIDAFTSYIKVICLWIIFVPWCVKTFVYNLVTGYW